MLFPVAACLVALVVSVSAIHADETTFVNNCGKCHQVGGTAPPVNPADKAGIVWIKYFKRQRHPVDLSGIISKEDMQSILQYLQKHAADSERPVAAAIPK
jgi:mono/diheme cytochrome c family protein